MFCRYEIGAGVVHTRLGILFAVIALPLWAIALGGAARSEIAVTMYEVSERGVGREVGRIMITESDGGLVFTPMLDGLVGMAGEHGFHVHERGDCGPRGKDGKEGAALAAGGHYDPDGTGRHEGPTGQGHKGDLPALHVGDDGRARQAVTAPRLKALSEVRGRALIVHAGGDNHADEPKPLGGGGARLLCGIVR